MYLANVVVPVLPSRWYTRVPGQNHQALPLSWHEGLDLPKTIYKTHRV